jgi:hypothetical protein
VAAERVEEDTAAVKDKFGDVSKVPSMFPVVSRKAA